MNTMSKSHYVRLVAMTVLSFLAMYMLMYAMVDSFSNVFSNFNQFYMAGLMAAPMVIIELALMSAMYPNKKWNALIATVSVIALITFWVCIRQQVAISDKQFLKSMIPHHAGAILMCEQASIKDSEIKELCREIISGQQREIDQMKAKLNALR
jgi:uncharacterized protein (DUF305 family)